MNTVKISNECSTRYNDMTLDDHIQWENLGQIISIGENETFIEADQLVEYCYYVKKGRVISYHLYPDGRERIFEIYDEGQLFLENSLLFDAHSPVSYKTTTVTELIRISKCRIKKEIKDNPVFALNVMKQTSYKYQSSMEGLRNATTQNVNWKVCDFFLSFAERYGIPYKGRILIGERVSQQFISNYTGINRITVVRAVKELKNLQLIEKMKSFYYICDLKKLKEYQKSLDRNYL